MKKYLVIIFFFSFTSFADKILIDQSVLQTCRDDLVFHNCERKYEICKSGFSSKNTRNHIYKMEKCASHSDGCKKELKLCDKNPTDSCIKFVERCNHKVKLCLMDIPEYVFTKKQAVFCKSKYLKCLEKEGIDIKGGKHERK